MQNRLTDIIEWDRVNWGKALPFWDRRVPSDLSGRKVLELGGRRGGLALWAALKGADVICSDLEGPQDVASVIHARYPECAGRISYAAVDALDIPYENELDIVCFKSILGGIARVRDGAERDVLRQIHKALKGPDASGGPGKLLLAENLAATGLHGFCRKKLRKWGGSWHYQRFDELKRRLEELFGLEYRTAGFTATFGLGETMKNMLGRLDSALFDRAVPENWRYIFIGVCTKKTT